jgi:uracil-DNA glycosylase family 4
MSSALRILNQEIVSCTRCARLTEYREMIGRVKRRAYIDQEYWAKPVPGFGDLRGRVLLLGLAPGAHGSNRTGRPFTGDGSGYFLYPVLYKAGFASQPNATNIADGMKLHDAYITSAVRCAPPGNKPLPEEISTCAQYLDRELALLKNVRVVVALGRIGFDAYLNHLRRQGLIKSRAPYVFGHGRYYTMPDGRILLASFHPSLQNTNTGKLTEAMFLEIFKLARRLADEAAPKRRADQRSTASGRPDRESLPPTRGRSRRAVRS